MIWTGGVKASSKLSNFNLGGNVNGLNLNHTLQVIGYDNIFAIGDCVDTIGDVNSRKRAQTAYKHADVAALNIANKINSKKLIEYHVADIPTIISMPKCAILTHKGLIIQNRLISVLELAILFRHKWKYG